MNWLFFSILLFVFAFLGQRRIGRSNNKCFLLFRFLLIFTLSYMTGMGGSIGTDHINYADAYHTASNISWSEIFEPGFPPTRSSVILTKTPTGGLQQEYGFVLLLKTFSSLGFSEVAFFFTISFLTNTFIVLAIYRYPFVLFQVLLFILSDIYFQQSNLVRSMLAISLFVYSIKYLEQRKYNKFVLIMIIAGTLHASMFFLLAIVFGVCKLCDKIKYRYLFIFFVVLWVFSLFVGLNLLHLNLGLFGDILKIYEISVDNSDPILGFRLICNIYVLLIIIAYNKKLYKDQSFIELCIIIYAILYNLSPQFYIVFRFAYCFNIFLILYLPSILFKIAKGKIHLPQYYYIPILVILYNLFLLIKNRILFDGVQLGSEMSDFSELFN